MIENRSERAIINKLAALFSYGINNRYSYTSIEEYIVSSSFINELENCRFASLEIEILCREVYHLENEVFPINVDIESRFCAEVYIYLFFKMQKSFKYLFLYMPLSDLINNYEALHTADYSKVEAIIKERIKNEKLLSRLANKRKIKLTELSSLTGININTIKKYAYSDEALYSASIENIALLSLALNVKENIFFKSLYVFIDNGAFHFDKTDKKYRNYLGILFASYYDSRITFSDFHYNEKSDVFVSNKDKTIIKVFADDIRNINLEKNINSSSGDTIFVFFDYSRPYYDVSQINTSILNKTKDIIIINQEYCYILKKHHTRMITDTINRILIMRAKNYAH